MASTRAQSASKSAGDGIPSASEAAPRLDQGTVLKAYSKWAPIYDFVFGRMALFGAFFDGARRAAIDTINGRAGRVLELGVGTGIALSRYAPHLSITGIDLSPDMLAVARKRVADEKLAHVEALLEMDAGALAFPTASFDLVVVMYTITVVPHPDQVMDEVARVLKPGGRAFFVSHFASEQGWRAGIEATLTPMTKKLGWRPDFPISRVTSHPRLQHVSTTHHPPLGVFSIVEMERLAD